MAKKIIAPDDGAKTEEVKKPRKRRKKRPEDINSELVKMELYNVYLKCMQEIPVMAKDKESGRMVPTGVYEFDARCALKALELLGDAVGVFKQPVVTSQEAPNYEEFLKTGGYSYEF